MQNLRIIKDLGKITENLRYVFWIHFEIISLVIKKRQVQSPM